MRKPPRAALLALVLVAIGALAAPAIATFASSDSAAHSVSTATLSPASGLSAANGTCTVLSSTHVNLSWTATPSTFAEGYQILRSTTSGGPYTPLGTVAGRSTTTFVDTSPAFSTTYYYVVRATKLAWRSADSNQASVRTPSSLCVV